MRIERRAAVLGGMTVALTLALAGCSAGGEATETSQQDRTAVSSLVNTPPELQTAVDQVARECLVSQGFAVPPIVGSSWRAYISPTGLTGLMPTVELAKQQGYTSTIKGNSNWADTFRATLAPKQAAAFDVAYAPVDGPHESVTLESGTQASRASTGCNADGQKAVYGSVKTGLEIDMFVNEVLSQGDNAATQQLVGQLIGDYESCMKSKGYQVSGLHASDLAKKEFGTYRQPGQQPSAAESKMAGTDADCQAQSGLTSRVDGDYFNKAASWIKNHESMIVARQESLNDSLARAKKILENG